MKVWLKYSTYHELPSFQWGSALKAEHEEYLVTLNGHVPIFVTDYPAATKPFYTRANEDSSNTVSTYR